MTDTATLADLSEAELADAWRQAKADERDAARRRLEIETAILQIKSHELPEKGTTNLACGMKIVTSFTESWDQERLNQAYQNWPANVAFPFKGEWKPDGKAIAYLRENIPNLYAAISPALTLRPSRPSFSARE
jgi:hypothetical protein